MYILVYGYDKVSAPHVIFTEDDVGNVSRERLDTPRQLNEGENPIGYYVLGCGETRKDAYDYMIKTDSFMDLEWLYDAPDFECDMLDTYNDMSVLDNTTGYYFLKIDDDFYEWLSNSSYYGYSAIEMVDLNDWYDRFLKKLVYDQWDCPEAYEHDSEERV
jgi:hypothetical protein